MNKRIARIGSILTSLTASAFLSSGVVIGKLPKFYLTGNVCPLTYGEKNYIPYFIHNTTFSSTYVNMTVKYVFAGTEYDEICSVAPFTINPMSDQEMVLPLPASYLSKSQVSLRFNILNPNSYIANATFYTKDRLTNGDIVTIDPFSLTNYTFVGKSNYVLFNSYLGNTRCADKIVFDNFKQFYTAEYYHRLSFDNIYFSYTNPVLNDAFTYEQAYLEIKDNIEKDYFKYLSNDAVDGYRRLPLNIKKITSSDVNINQKYQVSLNSKLYVNPDTLIMSVSPLPGFQETNYFYFPKNGFNSQKITEFRLVIHNCTSNNYDIKTILTYETEKAFFGNCMNSKYCISTNNNNSNDDYGEELPL